jgi:D-glycero-D-manno-heptose 1,7-bisphosphate phosphatase
MNRRAVFLDRDGTLIEEKHYLHRPAEVSLYPGAPQALARLQEAGFVLFLVTNQSGVGRGYFTMEDVGAVHRHIADLLAGHGVRFTEVYVAPEAPEQPSRGRKPSPQFLFDARDQFDVDLSQSYMVGDKLIDLECGWNAGVRKSILVLTGYGREVQAAAGDRLRDGVIAQDLAGVADYILG